MSSAKEPRRQRGRPRRAQEPGDALLRARCTQEEFAAAQQAAERLGESLSDFVRSAVAERCRRLK